MECYDENQSALKSGFQNLFCSSPDNANGHGMEMYCGQFCI